MNSTPRADSRPLPLGGIRVLDLSGETTPIETNRDFLRAVLDRDEVVANEVRTHFLDEH